MTTTSTFKNTHFTPILLAAFLVLGISIEGFATTYTSNAVTGNWNVGSSWAGNTAPSGLASDVIVIVAGANITVTATTTCSSITLNNATTANSLAINSGVTLTTGAVTLTTSTAAASTLAVGAGTLTCTSIAIPGGAAAADKAIVSISTGTINCSGNITFSGTPAQAQLTFTGGGVLNIQGNLGGGGTFAASTGTVNFNGTSAQTAGGTAAYTYNAVTIDNAVGVTLGVAATISSLTIGDVTANSIFNDGGFVITPAGSKYLNLNSGTYNLGSATVGTAWPAWTSPTINTGTTIGYVSGTTQTVSAAPAYQYLTLSGAGAKTITTATTVALNLAVGSPATVNAATVNVTGNISGTGAITMTTGTINIGGNWTNSGVLVPGTSATVNFNGGSTQYINTTLASMIFNNVTLSSGQTLQVAGSTTTLQVNTLTLNSGTFVAGTATQINVKANWTNNEAGANFTPGTGTVSFTGAAAQNINGTSGNAIFYNLILNQTTASTLTIGANTTTLTVNNYTETSGSFTFTALATFNINGTVTLSSGTFKAGNTNAANMAINIAGSWVNNDATAWTPSTSIVTMTGSGQTLGGTVATTFYVLQIADGASISLNGTVGGFTCTNLVVGNGASGSLSATTYPITVNGNASAPYDGLVINGGATLSTSTGTLIDKWDFNNSGTFTTTSTGALTMSGAGSFNFNNNGTFNAGTGTVSFTGTLAGGVTYTINGNDPAFYNMTENSATMTLNPSMNMSSTGTFTISAGTFNAPGLLTLKNVSVANAATAILNASTEIDVSGNWSILRVSSFVNNSGLVKFIGTTTQTVGGISAVNYYDVEIASTGGTGATLTNAFVYNITDNLTIDNGALLTSGTTTTINIGYQWINNGGSFTPSTGTVDFNNGGYYNYITGTATSATFNNLTVNDAYYLDATALNTLTVNAIFTMTAGGLNPPATMTVTGNIILTAGTFFSPTTILNAGGNWTNNGGTFDTWDCSCNGVVNFNGVAAQSIAGTATTQSFQDLVVNKTGAGAAGTLTNTTVTTFTVNDNFTLTAGTFTCGLANSTLNFNWAGGSSSSFTFNGGAFTTTIATCTVNVNGPGSQTGGSITSISTNFNYTDNYSAGQQVITGSYKNLTFDNNNKTLSPGTITVTATFTPGIGTGYTTTGNTVVLSGTANTYPIPAFNFDGINGSGYNNLTVSNAQSLGGSVAVNGTLTYTTIGATAGYITLGSNSLMLGGTTPLSPAASSSHFVVENGTGRLIRAFNNTGAQSYTYPIGLTAAAASYAPVTLAFDNITTPGNVGVALHTGSVDPNAVAPPSPSTNWLKAYWVLDNNSSAIAFDYYSATVLYTAAVYNTNLTAGAGGESTMGAMIYVSSLYNPSYWSTTPVVSSHTALNPTVTGITNFGDLTFATCVALADAGDPTNQGFCSTMSTGSVAFSVDVTGTPASYQWYQNGVSLGASSGIYTGTQTPLLTLNFSSNPSSMNGYTYYCVVTAECTGTFTSGTATLNVASEPTPSFTLTVSPSENLVWDQGIAYGEGRWCDEQCYGSTYTFTCNATTGILPITYTWIDFEAFLEFTSSSNQWVINTAGSTRLDGTSWAGPQWWGNGTDDIVVFASNACTSPTACCDADIIIMVDSSRTLPSLNAKTPNTASVCQGTSVSATALAGSGGDCTDGMPYNAATNEPKLISCTDEYQYIIDGGTPVTYTPGAGISTATAQSSVVIQGSRSGGTGPGVCSGTGWVTLASWTVIPHAQVNPTTASICTGGSGTTLTASGGGTYTWSPGTGLSGTSGASVTANPGTSTTYTVTDVNSGCTTTASAAVTVNITPTVSFSGLNADYCVNGSAATLIGTPAGGMFTGTGISGNTFTPSSAGIGGPYTVTYAYNNGTCGSSSSNTTSVKGVPVPTFTSAPSGNVCSGTSEIYSTQAGENNYVWGFPGEVANTDYKISSGGTSTDNTVTLQWLTSGSKSVTINYSDVNTCSATSPTSTSVNVNLRPTPTFAASPSTPQCASTAETYTTQAGQSNYVWTISGTLNSDYIITAGSTASNSVTLQWLTAGSQTVPVNYTNAAGCNGLSPASSTINVNPLPNQYDVTGGLCVPADLGLSNSDAGINYYLQLNGTNVPGGMKGGNGSLLDFGYQNSPGVYNIKAINSATGCTDTMLGIYDVAICTATWTGGTSSDWFRPTNWSPQAVPNVCGVTVIIGNSFSNYPVISGTNVLVSNVQISAGASITLDRQSLSLCGNWSGGTGANASVTGTGEIIFSANVAQTISGNTQFNILQISNTSLNGVSLTTNASVSINGALWLAQGKIDVSAGSFTLLSTSSGTETYIDDFSNGYTGTISGNIIAQRYVPIAGANQHFISSPVNTPPFSQLGGWGPDGTYVIPSYDCDETKSAYGTPYGQVFQYNDGYMGPNQCMLGNWQIRSAGNTVNALGYSVYLEGNHAISLSGTANTGDINVSNLNNSGYPSVSTLQGHPIESGWNLVGNPYPSSIELTVDRSGNEFQDQVLVWKTTGPFAGTWQSYVIGVDANILIAPFQAFMVRVTPGSTGLHTYPFYQSERVRNANVSFYRAQAQNTLQLTVDFNGVQDMTTVAFNPSATNSFDDQYDANKPDGAPGRPTLYTTMNDNHWYSINTLPLLTQNATVPVGLRPEANSSMTIAANGIESFDPTTYIYLEDKMTGAWQNLRNGAYTFTTTTTDNQQRFVLHFTPPAIILTTDATCDAAGMINIEQPGSANWNYTVSDENNLPVSSGSLNANSPVTINANAGVYTLTLTDNNGYSVVKTVQVGGTESPSASFTTSATTALVAQTLTFTGGMDNSIAYNWDFGDGTTASGQQATHTYQATGAYTVTLKVTGGSGCISTSSQVVTITSRTATGLVNLTDGSLNIWSYENTVFVDFSKVSIVNAEVQLYNVLGQMLSDDRFGKSTLYSKDLTNMEAAYIIVKVINNDQITTKKVFISDLSK